jgi:hypothetical protein
MTTSPSSPPLTAPTVAPPLSDEARCDHALHFIVVEDEIEVRCRSRFCGSGGGVIVLHYFDRNTFQLTRTVKLADPAIRLNQKERG